MLWPPVEKVLGLQAARTRPHSQATTDFSTAGAEDKNSLQIGEDDSESDLRGFHGRSQDRSIVKVEEQKPG